ncbi:hypothetical protein COY32_05110 [candidate division WWE3 bacterium CG_4_10_14_0_2_um_filter_41_14]|uniref:N-acetyltransferase domain-containing protein n=1 Tax=candidate division WWE3 bacterium CG_4_10_14_0_2_um_filter_41_14 TaxID=1975072 RepID=A0A2M7THC6_UNCKA|nr:MAG: hypothetical protein COY32_05110 [candidate division WWE3 bacterium CG_4_10_14_0_2_um_filter_41_14]
MDKSNTFTHVLHRIQFAISLPNMKSRITSKTRLENKSGSETVNVDKEPVEGSLDKESGFRFATLDDVDQLISWFESEMGVEHSAADLEEYRVDFLKILSNEKLHVRIIRENGDDVGWVLEEESELPYEFEVLEVINAGDNDMSIEEILELFETDDPAVTWININAIELLSDARGKGIGQKAIDELLTEYESKRVSLVTFHTQMKNEAMIQIAKKSGFALLHVPDAKGEDGKPVSDDGRIFAIKAFRK